MDYGWGKPVYSGPGEIVGIPTIVSAYIPFKNDEGEKGILVPMCLPSHFMEVLVKEMESILKGRADAATQRKTMVVTGSKL